MARKSALPLPKITHRRSSYEHRSGMCAKGALQLAKAVTEKPIFIEDADGHHMRVWKPEELRRYTNADIKQAISRTRVVEREDMLEFIPEQGIKYAVTKGWLVQDEHGGFFFVTRKAAADLDLPRQIGGRKIQFLDRGL